MASFKGIGAVHKIMRDVLSVPARTITPRILETATVAREAQALVQPDLEKSLTDLRAFHNDHLLRIRELHLNGADPLTVSEQLSDVRTSLAKISFEISLRGENADLALLLGGSAVKGDHTFLTDLDLLVIPGRPQDVPAAKRVEELMLENLSKIGIDADPTLLAQFDNHTLNSSIVNRYALRVKDDTPGFLDSWDGKVWMAWGVYYNFLMDTQILAVSTPESRVPFHLRELQDFVYSKPKAMLDLCRSHYEGLMVDLRSNEEFSIKRFALRPLYEALYSFRVNWDLRDSSIWNAIENAYILGYLTKPQKHDLKESLNFFLRLRHDIGSSAEEALDTSILTPELRTQLAEKRALGLSEFNELIEIHGKTLRDISAGILSRLAEGAISKGDQS